MADHNLKVTIPASGKAHISDFLPQPSGGPGNLKSNVMGNGNIYVQQMILQNQGSNDMHFGDATTTATNGLLISSTGAANLGSFINYASYISDWWVVGTAGDVLFVLYNE